MVPQEEAMLAGMSVHFNGVTQVRGPNYVAQQGLFVVRDGDSMFELRPEKRRYLAGGAMWDFEVSMEFVFENLMHGGEGGTEPHRPTSKENILNTGIDCPEIRRGEAHSLFFRDFEWPVSLAAD